MQPKILAGQRVLVTGAGRGIGAAIARRCGEVGAHIAVNYRSQRDRAQRVVRWVQDAGSEAMLAPGDVTRSSDVGNVVSNVVQNWGGIEAVVCNAGAPVIRQRAEDVGWETLQQKVLGELKGAWLMVAETFPYLKESGGAVVFVTSGLAERPRTGFLAHGVAKAALNSMVRYLAFEWGSYGIRVNAVAPGLVLTDASKEVIGRQMDAPDVPLGRLATAEEVADAVVYLLSPQASGLTGVILPIAGGGHLGSDGSLRQ